MKPISAVSIAAILMGSCVSTVNAQDIFPANTNGTATGNATLTRGALGPFVCALTLDFTTGPTPGVHPTHTQTADVNWGTNTGLTPCPAITVDGDSPPANNPASPKARLTITSYSGGVATGTLAGLQVSVGPNIQCKDTGSIPVTITNVSGGVEIAVNNATVDGYPTTPDCVVSANLFAPGFTVD